jgi:hypothetical protein
LPGVGSYNIHTIRPKQAYRDWLSQGAPFTYNAKE